MNGWLSEKPYCEVSINDVRLKIFLKIFNNNRYQLKQIYRSRTTFDKSVLKRRYNGFTKMLQVTSYNILDKMTVLTEQRSLKSELSFSNGVKMPFEL